MEDGFSPCATFSFTRSHGSSGLYFTKSHCPSSNKRSLGSSNSPMPDNVTAAIDRAFELDAKATPGPWIAFREEAVVITEAKREEVTKAVLEEGRIICGSPGWASDDDGNGITLDEERDNAALIAESRTLLPAMARALKAAEVCLINITGMSLCKDSMRLAEAALNDIRAEFAKGGA